MSKSINKNLLIQSLEDFHNRMVEGSKKDPDSVAYARAEGFKSAIDYIKVLYMSELIQEK